MTVDDDASAVRRPARKFPVVPFVLVAAVVIGVWQYWSWGPYTVTLEAEGSETRDFVVVCSYATKWVHSVERLYAHTSVIGHGQSVKCPRHFLGPFGAGMTVSVYHPEYQRQWAHIGNRNDNKDVVLKPLLLDIALAGKNTNIDPKTIMTRHIYGIEYHYLPAFSVADRSALATRYVDRLKRLMSLAGGIKYHSANDPESMEYIDNLFREQ